MENDSSKFIAFLLYMVVSTFVGFVGLVMILVNAWRSTLGTHVASEWLFWAFVACFIPLLIFVGMYVRDAIRERK